MVKQHNQLMLTLLRLSDMAALIAAWIASYSLCALAWRLGWSGGRPAEFIAIVPPLVLSMVLVLLIFSRLGLYEPKRTKSLMAESANTAKAVLLAWAITYVYVGFMTPDGLGRSLMATVAVTWLVLAVGSRLTARAVLRWFRKRGWNLRYAAIVGTGRLGQKLYHELIDNKWTGIVPLYFVGSNRRTGRLLGLDVHGPADTVDEIMGRKPVDIVFVALPGDRHDEIERVLNALAMTTADVRIVPDLLSFHFLRHDVTMLDELPVISLTSSPQHGWNSVIKRMFDMVASAVAIVIFAAPMAAIAAAVKLTSSGPVLYRQKRTSLGGQPFHIIKFRTMVPDAEADTGPVWALPDDPRVTRFGRFLRRTSLDELPQLFNVLIGHMSLVGPRPERPELIERFRGNIPRYMLRHQVRAGLTGWAQVHGLRGSTSLRKRVQYDLYYISSWSLGLDLRILFMSLLRGFFHPDGN